MNLFVRCGYSVFGKGDFDRKVGRHARGRDIPLNSMNRVPLRIFGECSTYSAGSFCPYGLSPEVDDLPMRTSVPR